MAVFYVASDQPGAGKTAVCVTLADELRRQGKQVSVFKPLASTLDARADPDPGLYQSLLGQGREDWPFTLPDGGLTSELLDQVRAAFRRVSDGRDVVVVEGSSAVPDEDASKLVDALDAKVLLVARFRPDLDAAQLAGWKELFGERLLGYVINGLTLYQGTNARTGLLPSMESARLSVLGVVPEERKLLGISVGQLASHLNGRFVDGEELTDGLVEHFLVGGWSLDSGALYFGTRENKAAIIRGDRPDIQMGALQTPTTCIVLTAGIEPIEYVLNEAELEEVPVIVVEPGTLDTMAALKSAVDEARFDHPAKVRQFAALLNEHVDMQALWDRLEVAV